MTPRKALSNATSLNRKVATNEARQHLRSGSTDRKRQRVSPTATRRLRLSVERTDLRTSSGTTSVTATCGTRPEYRGRYNGVVRKRDRPTGHAKEQRKRGGRSSPSRKKGEYANPPSYWGNEEDGRELRTYIRNNQYTIRWGKRSRLENPCRARTERRIRTRLPRTTLPRSPRQPKVGRQTGSSGT